MVKKKNIRKSALLLIMIMLATGITACGTEEEPLPDLSAMGAVTAVSREEGSGTRAEFENLLKLPESDTGIVVDSTEKVLKKVEEDIPLVQKWLTDTFQGFCTEMEGAAIAQAAYLNGIPFLIVRAISDKADDSASMDYPEFERQAILHSTRLTKALIEAY